MNFFDRLQTLRQSRPHPCILTVRSENSDYCPYHASGKDSYMIVGHNMAWECFYGFWVGNCKNCVDCAFIEKSELCYESFDIHGCYDCTFCQDCVSCTECEWCYDCKGCTNCYGCMNLRNKEFYIFNKKYSREDYFVKLRELRARGPERGHAHRPGHAGGRRMEGRRMENPPPEFVELKNTLPHIAMQGVNNENAVGDHIFNSHDCFGCVSRNHAEYEILNQKYSKDEYFKCVAELKDKLRSDGTYGRWWWPSPYEEIKPYSSFMV